MTLGKPTQENVRDKSKLWLEYRRPKVSRLPKTEDKLTSRVRLEFKNTVDKRKHEALSCLWMQVWKWMPDFVLSNTDAVSKRGYEWPWCKWLHLEKVGLSWEWIPITLGKLKIDYGFVKINLIFALAQEYNVHWQLRCVRHNLSTVLPDQKLP